MFRLLSASLLVFAWPLVTHGQEMTIRHAVLIAGGFTGIIDEEGREVWSTEGNAKDATRLENGHVLITWKDKVIEFDNSKTECWRYDRAETDSELVSAWRLEDGNTMVVVLGDRPRITVVDNDLAIVRDVPVDPEQTENQHMQTRMARPLPNGNFIAPHLFGYSIREYRPDGTIVADFQTDTEHFGGVEQKNWPFTAIRLENGNTLVGCTYGNRVVEFNPEGDVVWEITNDDVGGIIHDACGVQRLPNGNTVVTSYGQREEDAIKLFEVTPEKKVVWSYRGHYAHHFQVLTTNGEPVPGKPMK